MAAFTLLNNKLHSPRDFSRVRFCCIYIASSCQVLLLVVVFLAVLPNIVNNQIRSEMYKGTDPTQETQFNKLYVYPMDNVSILFADIKVSQR